MKNGTIVNKSQRQTRKRDRAQKVKVKRVFSIGEHPAGRMRKNGKVRQYDLPGRSNQENHIPRKAREFMASMTRWNLKPSKDITQSNQELSKGTSNKHNKEDTTSERGTCDKTEANLSTSETPGSDVPNSSASGGVTEQIPKIPASEKRFDGMTTGETLSEYSVRLRKESQRMAIDIAKKGNHQSEKRKAYNKKRRERIEKRKKRRRGEYSDSDVEDDGEYDDNIPSICHLPAYWQEIVNNNGRPLSAKRKKRMQLVEGEAALKHNFGDQVDRPPELTVRPVRRNRNVAVHPS